MLTVSRRFVGGPHVTAGLEIAAWVGHGHLNSHPALGERFGPDALRCGRVKDHSDSEGASDQLVVITCELADFASVINNFYALLRLSSHAADYTDRPAAQSSLVQD